MDAAYRELFEETGISRGDIRLAHVMDQVYHCANCYVQVFAGRLGRDMDVYGDENELLWMDAAENFFDPARFAGDGNIGHILLTVERCEQQLLGN